MADIKNPISYKNGLRTVFLSELEKIGFDTNADISSIEKTIKSSIIPINVGAQLSGIYIIIIKPKNEDYNLSLILSVDARYAESSKSTINILGQSVNGIKYQAIKIKASQTTNSALILEMVKNEEYDVTITHIGVLSPLQEFDVTQYNIDIETQILSSTNIFSVLDDSTNINPSKINETSIINGELSEAYRISKSRKGILTTFKTNNYKTQLFNALSGEFKLLSNSKIIDIVSYEKYPRNVESGISVINVDAGKQQAIYLKDSSIDLTNSRYLVTLSSNVVGVKLKVLRKEKGVFTVVPNKKASGSLNYNIIELYSKDSEAEYSISFGRLLGSSFIPVTSISEGDLLRVVISCKNISDGTLVDYNISGVNQSDIDVSLSGSVEIQNSTGIIDIQIKNDFISDGDKTLLITLENGYSSSILVKDTSITPVFDVYFSSDAAGLKPITSLNSGFQIYLQVKGIQYDPSLTYQIDLSGSVELSNLIGESSKTFNVEFTNGKYTKLLSLNPSISSQKTIVLDTDTTDLNVKSLYESRYGLINEPINLKLITYATHSASSTNKYAFDFSQLPAGSIILLENRGIIHGMGGSGGYHISINDDSMKNGQNGGDCFKVGDISLKIENYGSIYSGGGGGGAAGIYTSVFMQEYCTGVSGGGGAPFGNTAQYVPMASSVQIAYFYMKDITNNDDIFMYTVNGLAHRTYNPDGNRVDITGIAALTPLCTASSELYGASYNKFTFYHPQLGVLNTPGSGGNAGTNGQAGLISIASNTNFIISKTAGIGGLAGKIINDDKVVVINNFGIIKGR